MANLAKFLAARARLFDQVNEEVCQDGQLCHANF